MGIEPNVRRSAPAYETGEFVLYSTPLPFYGHTYPLATEDRCYLWLYKRRCQRSASFSAASCLVRALGLEPRTFSLEG